MQSKGSIRTAIAVATCALALNTFAGTADVNGAPSEVDGKAAQYAEKVRRVTEDKAMAAAEIVLRWENEARAQGRWDMNYAQDMFGALMKLHPDNLVAASEATSYQGLMKVLMTGRAEQSITPKALGDFNDDMVYTPVAPCRIVDTRNAGGIIAANTTRSFDVDGSTFTSQGGINAPCGIPFGVARAVVMAVSVTQPDVAGFFRGWAVGSAEPFASFLNFVAGETIAVTTIIPVVPGGGTDFNLKSVNANAHAVIDVMGYFAAPAATALDCTTATNSGAIPASTWTHVVVSCPAGRTVTGGGFFYIFSNTQGKSNPSGNGWDAGFFTANASETGTVYAQCCRVPGR